MAELVFYTGPHCTLCEQAKRVVWPVIAATGHQLMERDITTNVDWLRQYRSRIPVVTLADRELNWPFDEQQLYSWLTE